MEETSKPNEYELKQEAEKRKRLQIEEETAAWINNNPKVKEYLSRFRERDVDSFVKRYPSLKAEFMYYGATLGDLPQQLQEGYIETAAVRLMDIQRKKLFDLMCQWDAELVKLEDVYISDHFLRWNHDLENCPYITPISGEEFALYMQFAATLAFDKDAEINIQYYASYHVVSEDEEQDDDVPAWFKFEDFCTGHSVYKKLPMIRTEKENFYTKLWSKERDEEINKKYESGEYTRYVEDPRAELTIWHYRHIEDFIIHNESDKEVLQLFRKHYTYFNDQLIRDNEEDEEDGRLTEQANNIIHQLSGIKEKIAVEANEDWRVALIEGFAAYEQSKVLQALPYAYSDYLMRKQLGISLNTEDDREKKLDLQIMELACNQVLRGRELNGEPRDFNF